MKTIRISIAAVLLLLSLAACGEYNLESNDFFCGDGTCEDGIEDCLSCEVDCGACGSSCGDGTCDQSVETCESCPEDCGACATICGDGTCQDEVEDCRSCEEDCGACGSFCGDDTCDEALEDCQSCEEDCGACAPFCGDGTCNGGAETCDSCENDCGPCGDNPEQEDPPKELSIVSWNVWHGNSRANFVNALKEFEDCGIDIVGFQELSDKGKPEALTNKTGCPGCYFDAFKPGKPSEGGNVSIMWKKSRFSVVVNEHGKKMQYAVKVHGREDVEDGAGGDVAGTKYIVYVFLKDKRTNRSFWMMNAHALPSVEGRCGHPNNKTRRLALYNKMMNTFKDKIKGKNKPVFVTGDYNLNYRCDKDVRHFRFPWKKFNSLNPKVKSNWEWHQKAGHKLPAIGTHRPHNGGKRIIDYVFAKADPDVSYKSTAIWQHRRFGSDHAPVRATYLIKPK